MTDQSPTFAFLHLVVRDIAASLAFYRRLGATIPPGAEERPHVAAVLPGGLAVEFDTVALTRGYDPGWREATGGSRTSFEFALPDRPAVDALYAALTAAGYVGHLPPHNAFWGARYAVVDDPDGNAIGLQSPADAAPTAPP